jgi:2-polyprenyl-6-methoxyphenol hydroxylase-like FAD-dependent oxidoreductase
MTAVERADVVVVGARCAGSAAAIGLAQAGRRVVALDRVHFPADTISTHLLWPGGVAELRAVGALDRVKRLGAPPLPRALAAAGELAVHGSYTPVEGIDYALCVRRPGLDAALVATARDAGAEVREGARVTALVTEAGRVAGVRWSDATGGEHELRAPLVVGADGRRSTVARLVGAQRPHRSRASGRACFYAYWEDGRPDWRATAAQWREGAELGTAFPCDDGLLLVLLQPPASRAREFRGELTGTYERTVTAIPGLAERLRGCRRVGKVRAATDLESYFRRSTGCGWALAGDAGHFKDPVTAQGIRDALHHGRALAEAAAPVLDDPRRLDAALARWERERDNDCLEIYQWTNVLAQGEPMSPLEIELYRLAQDDPALARQLLDVFSRSTRPSSLFTARRTLRLTAGALARRGGDRMGTLASARRDVATAVADWRERRAALSAADRAPIMLVHEHRAEDHDADHLRVGRRPSRVRALAERLL